jgi:hypothetical protein
MRKEIPLDFFETHKHEIEMPTRSGAAAIEQTEHDLHVGLELVRQLRGSQQAMIVANALVPTHPIEDRSGTYCRCIEGARAGRGARFVV